MSHRRKLTERVKPPADSAWVNPTPAQSQQSNGQWGWNSTWNHDAPASTQSVPAYVNQSASQQLFRLPPSPFQATSPTTSQFQAHSPATSQFQTPGMDTQFSAEPPTHPVYPASTQSAAYFTGHGGAPIQADSNSWEWSDQDWSDSSRLQSNAQTIANHQVSTVPQQQQPPPDAHIQQNWDVHHQTQYLQNQEVHAQPQNQQNQEVHGQHQYQKNQEVQCQPRYQQNQEVHAQSSYRQNQEVSSQPWYPQNQEDHSQHHYQLNQEFQSQPQYPQNQVVDSQPWYQQHQEDRSQHQHQPNQGGQSQSHNQHNQQRDGYQQSQQVVSQLQYQQNHEDKSQHFLQQNQEILPQSPHEDNQEGLAADQYQRDQVTCSQHLNSNKESEERHNHPASLNQQQQDMTSHPDSQHPHQLNYQHQEDQRQHQSDQNQPQNDSQNNYELVQQQYHWQHETQNEVPDPKLHHQKLVHQDQLDRERFDHPQPLKKNHLLHGQTDTAESVHGDGQPLSGDMSSINDIVPQSDQSQQHPQLDQTHPELAPKLPSDVNYSLSNRDSVCQSIRPSETDLLVQPRYEAARYSENQQLAPPQHISAISEPQQVPASTAPLQQVSAIPAPPQQVSAIPAPPQQVSAIPAPPQQVSAIPAPPQQVSAIPAPSQQVSASTAPQQVSVIPAPPQQMSAIPAPPQQVSAIPAPPQQVSAIPAPPQQVSASTVPSQQVSAIPAPPQQMSAIPAPPQQVSAIPAPPQQVSASTVPSQQVSAIPAPPQQMSAIPAPPQQVSAIPVPPQPVSVIPAPPQQVSTIPAPQQVSTISAPQQVSAIPAPPQQVSAIPAPPQQVSAIPAPPQQVFSVPAPQQASASTVPAQHVTTHSLNKEFEGDLEMVRHGVQSVSLLGTTSQHIPGGSAPPISQRMSPTGAREDDGFVFRQTGASGSTLPENRALHSRSSSFGQAVADSSHSILVSADRQRFSPLGTKQPDVNTVVSPALPLDSDSYGITAEASPAFHDSTYQQMASDGARSHIQGDGAPSQIPNPILVAHPVPTPDRLHPDHTTDIQTRPTQVEGASAEGSTPPIRPSSVDGASEAPVSRLQRTGGPAVINQFSFTASGEQQFAGQAADLSAVAAGAESRSETIGEEAPLLVQPSSSTAASARAGGGGERRGDGEDRNSGRGSGEERSERRSEAELQLQDRSRSFRKLPHGEPHRESDYRGGDPRDRDYRDREEHEYSDREGDGDYRENRGRDRGYRDRDYWDRDERYYGRRRRRYDSGESRRGEDHGGAAGPNRYMSRHEYDDYRRARSNRHREHSDYYERSESRAGSERSPSRTQSHFSHQPSGRHRLDSRTESLSGYRQAYDERTLYNYYLHLERLRATSTQLFSQQMASYRSKNVVFYRELCLRYYHSLVQQPVGRKAASARQVLQHASAAPALAEERTAVHSGRSSVHGRAADKSSTFAEQFHAYRSLSTADYEPSVILPPNSSAVVDSQYYSNADCSHVLPSEESVQQIQRLTPTKFSYPHVLARFGAGGQLVIVKPNSPAEGGAAPVEFHDICVLLQNHPESQQLRKFPGPLRKESSHKGSVLHFCQYMLSELESSPAHVDDSVEEENVDVVSSRLLWQLLMLLVRQNGIAVGSDIAELLLSEGDDHMLKTEAAAVIGTEITESASAPLQQFTELLLHGRQQEALDVAMKCGVWSHALLLASCMEGHCFELVRNRLVGELMAGQPLQTVYQLLAGRQPLSATMCTNERWVDWRPHLSAILSNGSSQPELSRTSVITMADTLASDGRICAAHICYAMADCTPGRYGCRTDKLVLLGSCHSRPWCRFARTRAIQRTEIYLYARSLALNDRAHLQQLIQNFQVFKYFYALRLLDYGMAANAVRYCEDIAREIFANPSLYSYALVSRVFDLACCLKYHDKQYMSCGHDSSSIPDPDWLQSLQTTVVEMQSNRLAAYPDCSHHPDTAAVSSVPLSAPAPDATGYDQLAHQSSSEQNQNLAHSHQQWSAVKQAQHQQAEVCNEPNSPTASEHNQQNMAHTGLYGPSVFTPLVDVSGHQMEPPLHQPSVVEAADGGADYWTSWNYSQCQSPAAEPGCDGEQFVESTVDGSGKVMQSNNHPTHQTDVAREESDAVDPDLAASLTPSPPPSVRRRPDALPLSQSLSASQCRLLDAIGFSPPVGPNSGGTRIRDRQPGPVRTFPVDMPCCQPPNLCEDHAQLSLRRSNSLTPLTVRRSSVKSNRIDSVEDDVAVSKSSSSQPVSLDSARQPAPGAGWLGGLFSKFSKPKNQMILPDDKEKPIVWDEQRKCWVDKTASESADFSSAPVAPPSDSQLMSPTSNASQSSAPPLPTTSATGNRFKIPKGRGMRANYVDVLGGSTSSSQPMPAMVPGAPSMINHDTGPSTPVIPDQNSQGRSMTADGDHSSSAEPGSASGPIMFDPAQMCQTGAMQASRGGRLNRYGRR